jgi:hypothetical protein
MIAAGIRVTEARKQTAFVALLQRTLVNGLVCQA